METSLLVGKNDKPDDEAYKDFLTFAEAQKEAESLHLFFFKVGHGNFILVRDKDNAIVVDAGSDNKNTVGTYIKDLFLACLGEAHLSQIIITHNHKDHKNYVKDVKKWGNKDTVQEISPNPFEFATIIRWQVPSGSPIPNANLSFLQPLTVLQANSQDAEAIKRYENHRSSVFVLTYQGIKVLFTGDATGLSLDNYVEKHQEFSGQQNDIVDANREVLKNIHLFVMPHHGASTEDSFRWTLYVTKHSSNLLASVICGDPFVDKYKDVRNWVRDISWPNSMRNNEINNSIYYWSARSEVHKKQTNAALFITGAEPCRCVYFKIHDENLYKYDAKKKDFNCLRVLGCLFDDNCKNYEGYDNGDNAIQMEMEENNNKQNVNCLQVLPGTHSFVVNGNLMQNQEKKEEKLSQIKSPFSQLSIGLQGNNLFTNKGSTLPKPPKDSHKKEAKGSRKVNKVDNSNNITINNPEQMEEDFEVSAILSQEQE